MFWPDTQTGVDVQPERKAVQSAVRKYFTEGGVGVPPTVPGGDWFNQITNELLNVLAAAGIDPSKADDDQLLEAIKRVSNSTSAREALRRSYSEAGYTLVNGSFESGGTLTSLSDVLLHEATGKAFTWEGSYLNGSHTVMPGTDPSSDQHFADKSGVEFSINNIAAAYGLAPSKFKMLALGASLTLGQWGIAFAAADNAPHVVAGPVASFASLEASRSSDLLLSISKSVDVTRYGAVAVDPSQPITQAVIDANTTAFRNAAAVAKNRLASVFVPPCAPFVYPVSENIDVGGITTHGVPDQSVIKQITSTAFAWTSGSRVSPAPIFKVTANGTRFFGLKFVNKYEAILANTSGISGLVVDTVTINNPDYSVGSGIVWFGCNDVIVRNSRISNCGARSSWSGTANNYGSAQGIDFGVSSKVKIINNIIEKSGQNGVFYYCASDVEVIGNTFYRNEMSGFQLGPHASYRGCVCENNTFIENYSDGIDINWTGSGIVAIHATITGNRHYRNGYWGGDTSKPTQDGSGVATLRRVSDWVCSGNYSYDNAGIGAYLTNTARGELTNNIIYMTTTAKEGVFVGETTHTDLKINNNIVICAAGSALNLSNGVTFSRIDISWNTFYSATGYSATFGNTNVFDTGFDMSRNTFVSSLTMYPYFNMTANNIVYTGSNGSAVEYNSGNKKFRQNTVVGTSTAYLVRAQNKNLLDLADNHIENLGTGGSLDLNGCDDTKLLLNKLLAVSGTSLRLYSNGSNFCDRTDIAYNTITGATAIYSNYATNTYMNRNNVTGTETYLGDKPFDASYVQRT